MENLDELLAAIKAGDRAQAERLVQQDPSLANASLQNGLPVVLYALYYQQPGIAALLADAGADLSTFAAAALGRIERLRALLDEDPQQVSAVSVDGFQPLGLAAFFGQLEAARLLVERGAEVNVASQNAMRVMPLHSAVAGQHLEIARLLLEHGADPNTRQADDFTPLHGAAQNGQTEMIRLLLAHGADRRVASADGKTALDFAQESQNSEALALLGLSA